MTPEQYQKVCDLFFEAKELPPVERDEFLSHNCGDDHELRKEVESLLASDDSAGDFIRSPAIEVAAEMLADESKAKIGRQIGHYKIVSLLGTGGMGEVWLAEDARLKRQIALKLLSVVQKQDRLQRFRQEAHAVSALNHPNIITIFDIGQAAEWQFIATEFVEGKTLRQLIKEKSLTIAQGVDIALQISAALAAAHSQGIIHRDIKPENVMVRSDGIVKVLDFGLAKLLPQGHGDAEMQGHGDAETRGHGEEDNSLIAASPRPGVSASLTNPGLVMGTAAYMSPEQARGEQVDEKTDVFSLGIVLYEMLNVRHPFEGKNEIEILAAILERAPAPLNENLPESLQNIISQLLSKNPSGRFQSSELPEKFRSLKRDLEFQDNFRYQTRDDFQNPNTREIKPVTGTSPAQITKGFAARVKSWSFRSKLAAALTLLLAVTTGFAVYFQVFAKRAPSAAILTETDQILIADFENKTGDEDFDGTLRQLVAIGLAQSPFMSLVPDGQIRQTLKMMEKKTDEPLTVETAREICQRRGVKAFLKGTIENYGVQYLLTLEAFNTQTGEAIVTQKSEAKNKDAVISALNEATLKIREKLGESLASIEKFDAPVQTSTTNSLEALRTYTAAFRANQSGNTKDAIPFLQRAIVLDPNFAAAYAALAITYYNNKQFGLAADYAEKAYNLRDHVTEREKLRLTDFYYALVTGEADKSIETLELYKQTYPRDNLPPANLAAAYTDIGKYAKAEENARLSINIDPAQFVPYSNLGRALIRQSRFDEAKTVYENAMQRGLNNVEFNGGLFTIAFVKGDTAAMQQQIEAMKGKPDEDWALMWQGNQAIFAGQWREYEKFINQAVGMVEKEMPDVAADYASQAALNAAVTGQCDKAKTWAKRALKNEHPQRVLTDTALTFALCGEKNEALIAELKERFPKNTVVNSIWLPIIRAASEIETAPDRAVETLEINRQYEGASNFWDNYLRGQAYLKLKKPESAITEFQKIIQNRGWAPSSPLFVLAHLELSNAYTQQNDAAKANQAKEQFLTLWKNADADLPVLKKSGI